MAQKLLDVADIATTLEKMGGEAVSEGVAAGRFAHPGLLDGQLHRVLQVLFPRKSLLLNAARWTGYRLPTGNASAVLSGTVSPRHSSDIFRGRAHRLGTYKLRNKSASKDHDEQSHYSCRRYAPLISHVDSECSRCKIRRPCVSARDRRRTLVRYLDPRRVSEAFTRQST